MNVYQVVSEVLQYEETIDAWIGGPMVDYRIGEIVAAPTPGRAKWIAWASDSESFSQYGNDIRDMPKFSVKLVRKDAACEAGILKGLDYLWTGVRRPWLLPEATLVDDWLWQERAVHQDADEWDFFANGALTG